MQQFVPCTGCGNQVLTPEFPDGMHVPQALTCKTCGQEFPWDPGILDDGNAITKFSIIDTAEIPPTDTDIESAELDSLAFETPESPKEALAESSEPALELELELELDESEEVKEAGFTEVKSSEQPSAHDWSVLGPPIKRRRNQEVSAIRKILPPVLGGLAAFPIATLIMWYGFGKDLGSTGPTVAQYVPWIVPQKLRNSPWQYSDQGSRGNSSSAQRSQRSAPQPRASFPSLNRENLVAKSSISETIVKLRTLQEEWNNIPMSDNAKMVKMVGNYYSEMRRLSEQSAELKGRSASVWRKELESISREVLSHPHIPRALQRGAIGKLPGVPVSSLDDFIATVITIGDDNEPMPNTSWILQEKWSSGTIDIRIEILPGAWRAGYTMLPATCLVLGKLVASETSEMDPSTGEAIPTTVVLKVHSLLPK